MEEFKITNEIEYEKAKELKKELRDKIFNLRVKIATEPTSEIERKKIEKEALNYKKQLSKITYKITEYELNNNIIKKEGKKL